MTKNGFAVGKKDFDEGSLDRANISIELQATSRGEAGRLISLSIFAVGATDAMLPSLSCDATIAQLIALAQSVRIFLPALACSAVSVHQFQFMGLLTSSSNSKESFSQSMVQKPDATSLANFW
jgi:hypothetical protein